MEYKFNTQNFEEEVLKSDIPVLVDCYADWCGPCRMMAPVVEALAEQFDGKMKIGKLNVEESGDIAAKYRVMNIPTFLFIKGGQVVETAMGAMQRSELEMKCKALLQEI